jgi:hypothetical protein
LSISHDDFKEGPQRIAATDEHMPHTPAAMIARPTVHATSPRN